MDFKNYLLFLLVLATTLASNAQEVLTVEEAVKIALENNYQIKTAKNDLRMDETAVSPGQAGICLLYTSPSPRDRQKSRMPSSA